MEQDGYRNVRDKIESVNERVLKGEGRQDGHEMLCAQRYGQILKELTELRASITTIAKVGLFMAFALFMIELGKATFPALFDAITRIH